MARKASHLYGLLALVDPLLGRSPLVVEAHHRPAPRLQVSHDEPDRGNNSPAWNSTFATTPGSPSSRAHSGRSSTRSHDSFLSHCRQRALHAKTETEAIQRALDFAIAKHEKNRRAALSHPRFRTLSRAVLTLRTCLATRRLAAVAPLWSREALPRWNSSALCYGLQCAQPRKQRHRRRRTKSPIFGCATTAIPRSTTLRTRLLHASQ